MPQIWLTYDELGSFMKLTGAGAREGAIEAGWSRRRCGDGLTRVKLPPASATLFLRGQADAQAQSEIAALRALLADAQVQSLRALGCAGAPKPLALPVADRQRAA